MEQVGLFLLAALLLVSAVSVILMESALYSALSLIINLVALAILFLVMSAQFLFVAQILVYAGAIMVLFMFTVTILNPPNDTVLGGTHRLQFAGALLFGALLGGFLTYLVSTSPVNGTRGTYSGLTGTRGDIQAFGIQLFTVYLLPLEVTALILLVGIVGAVVLGKRASELAPTRGTYKMQLFTDVSTPPQPVMPAPSAMPEQVPAETVDKDKVGV